MSPRPPNTSTGPLDELRLLPAPEGHRSRCEGCGSDVVWAITVATASGRGGKLMPLDPREDLGGNVLVCQPVARGRLTARVLHAGETVDRPMDYLANTHFATCPVGVRPTPPLTALPPTPRAGRGRGARRARVPAYAGVR